MNREHNKDEKIEYAIKSLTNIFKESEYLNNKPF